MGHVGHHRAALLVGALQLLGHAVEGVSQLAKLRAAALGHTYTEIALGHRVCGLHDIGQRCGDAAKCATGQHDRQYRQRQRQAAAAQPDQCGRLLVAAEPAIEQPGQQRHPADNQQYNDAKNPHKARKQRSAVTPPAAHPGWRRTVGRHPWPIGTTRRRTVGRHPRAVWATRRRKRAMGRAVRHSYASSPNLYPTP